MKILGVLVLAVSLAQVFPSCGPQSGDIQVIGWVEEKRFFRPESDYILVINGHEYIVPEVFWRRVDLGDLVKYDGIAWTIVRKAGATPTPTRTPAPSPTR